jgi:hypothetical protein
VAPARRDLGQRDEDKTPLCQARVRQDEAGPPRHAAAEVEDVAVDHARPVAERRDAASLALDALDGRQQRAR